MRRRHTVALFALLFIAAFVATAVFVLADDDPPAEGDVALPAGCSWQLPYVICTYSSSTTMSADEMVEDIEGYLDTTVSTSTPVWVQAWAGRGGNGAEYLGANKGEAGDAGYAMTTSSVGALQGKTLYLYVGQSGTHSGSSSGQGGSSTIVSTQLLSKQTSFPGGLLVVAGGGGGGGQGCSDAKGGNGGDGGVAIAGSGPASDGGGNGTGYSGNIGYGGNSSSNGNGGATGGGGGANGNSGLGGVGGTWTNGSGSVGWNDVSAVDPGASSWSAGRGGKGAGGGGGGYGGGGGGQGCTDSGFHGSGGGGGGGSYAIARAVYDASAPTASQQGGTSTQVILTFHLS